MKIFLVACLAAVVIALAGGVVLDGIQKPVETVYATSAVRL